MVTKLITIPKFAEETGLPYRLCLHLVGTGQIPSVAVGRRRRIDVRWRLVNEDFLRMPERQLALTRKMVPLLKKGGILVYSTCSIAWPVMSAT